MWIRLLGPSSALRYWASTMLGWAVHPLRMRLLKDLRLSAPSPVAPSLLLLLDLECGGQTALRILAYWPGGIYHYHLWVHPV